MSIALSRDQVRRVDELAVRKYGIAGLVLMENAGRNAAAIIDREFGHAPPAGNVARAKARGSGKAHDSAGRSALIFCGTGNNGGDGCVIARHLHNVGWSVRLAVTGDETKMSPDMLANYHVVSAMNLETYVMADQGDRVAACDSIGPSDLVIDAILGTGFRGQVHDDLAEIIEGINHAKKRAVVAIDVPSGLDCDTGEPGGPAVRADLTVTFVADKIGFAKPAAKPFVGRVEVADIGAPREMIAEVARA